MGVEDSKLVSGVSAPVAPFHTFIVKSASRCNLNCSYCFVYNRGDDQWRHQPPLISPAMFGQTLARIKEHCDAHHKSKVAVVLHGGEPLLGGVRHLGALAGQVKALRSETGIQVALGVQSNGLLFSDAIGDLMLDAGMSIGISLDGPPESNDRFRVDKRGRPSTKRLEERLRLLTSPKYRKLLSGFLCVVDLENDPVEVIDYLASFDPPMLDFLLPYDNHDRRPPGKEDLTSTPYADWLIRAFEHWFFTCPNLRIREFDSIIRQMLGGSPLVESLGAGVVDLIVVETNGDIEAVDSLKATFNGATKLGFHIEKNTFDEVAHHQAVRARQLGLSALPAECRECYHREVCGGGYIPNRYSSARGFDNPSVYCADLKRVIDHIHERLSASVMVARSAKCSVVTG